MRKIIGSIGKISKLLATLFAVFTLGYFAFLFYLEKFFPLPISVQIGNIYVRALAIGFFILLPMLLVSNFSKIFRTVLFILAIPFCCVFSYILIESPKEILQMIEFGNHRYYITVEAEPGKSHTIYKTYMCNRTGLECQVVYSDRGRSTIDEVNFIVNENMTELHVLRDGFLKYTYGSTPWETVTSIEKGSFIYYMGVYPPYTLPSEQRTYVLYKCQNSLKVCEQLPFQYTKGGAFELKFDESTNELIVYESKYERIQKIGDVKIFSYGAEPRCFVEQCTILSK